MNEFLLQPIDNELRYVRMFTRPSPLPPEAIELGVMEVCHLCCPAGEVFPPAESYFTSLIWGMSGRFSVYVDDKQYTVSEGEFLLLKPGGILHPVADKEGSEVFYLLLDGPQAQQIISECGFWNGTFTSSRSPVNWLECIAKEMHDLSKQQTLASIAHSLMVTAYQDAAQHAPDKMVWDACAYLQKNWNREGLNVDALLAELQVSRSTLSPRFKKVTGQSMLDYLMDIRYQNALQMLTYAYASVAQIAKNCGFPDSSYFSTWFKKRNGRPPRAVKQKRP